MKEQKSCSIHKSRLIKLVMGNQTDTVVVDKVQKKSTVMSAGIKRDRNTKKNNENLEKLN